MRWNKVPHDAPKEFDNRYVRRFAWFPMYDFDTRETVWLEWFHCREYFSVVRDHTWCVIPRGFESFASYPIIYDSRKV